MYPWDSSNCDAVWARRGLLLRLLLTFVDAPHVRGKAGHNTVQQMANSMGSKSRTPRAKNSGGHNAS